MSPRAQKVVVVARDKDGVAEAVAELGPEHLGIVCDVTRDAEGETCGGEEIWKIQLWPVGCRSQQQPASISSPSNPCMKPPMLNGMKCSM